MGTILVSCNCYRLTTRVFLNMRKVFCISAILLFFFLKMLSSIRYIVILILLE
jgi:hypothetical protein